MRDVWVPMTLRRLVCLRFLLSLTLMVLVSLWLPILRFLLLVVLWLVATNPPVAVLLCQWSSITISSQLHILRLLWGNVQIKGLPYKTASPAHTLSSGHGQNSCNLDYPPESA